jgi:DNA-binding response OmpR family regulator
MKKRIGIIDDDDQLSEILTSILEDEGFSVTRFSDTMFLNILEDENFDMVILDVWFDTHCDGIKMAQAILSNEHLKETPILMMSSDPNLKEYAKKAGVKNYLKKPIDFPTMLVTVKKLSRTH